MTSQGARGRRTKYRYDSLDRVASILQADASQWIYGYNNRDEVTAGSKYWADFTPMAGGRYSYAYDNQGNRAATGTGKGGDDNGAGLRMETYAVNTLNQYTSRTLPGVVDLTGAATVTAGLTATLTPPGQSSTPTA